MNKYNYKNNDKEKYYNKIQTEIDFQYYKNCIQSNIDDINTISKCNKIGGNITTEQKFIKHDRIMDLFHDKNIDNAMPVIIEYNYESKKFYIVDGNHGVSYHILNNFKYIPVMIIFKEIIISTKRKIKEPRISSSKKSRLTFS
jgi:hypothetical protein